MGLAIPILETRRSAPLGLYACLPILASRETDGIITQQTVDVGPGATYEAASYAGAPTAADLMRRK